MVFLGNAPALGSSAFESGVTIYYLDGKSGFSSPTWEGYSTVNVDETVAPGELTYSANPAIYTVDMPITNNAPRSTGDTVIVYLIAPVLPAGLSFDTATGVISGTPTELSAARDYTIAMISSGGLTTATVHIAVNDVAPAELTYTTNAAIYTKGIAIAENTPSTKGGAVLAYTIAPALPAGLSLDTGSGVISGTPSELSAATVYAVTATNSGGSAVVTVSITVHDVPPSALTYATNPAIYTVGLAIAENAPSSAGGAVVAHSIAPPLPSGLRFHQDSGVISGTPSALSEAAHYVVTATNSGGSTQATLRIAVNDVAPGELHYAANPATYTVGVTIAGNAPSSTGGAVVSYAIAPPLPSGLSFDTDSGVISGTPAQPSAPTDYTVSATNSGGSTTATVSITVHDEPPSDLTYATNPAIYAAGVTVSENTPSTKGGAVLAYTIAPALPAGLSLDTGSGVISGTPSELSAATVYMVTATNSGGSAVVTVSITVNDVPPSALTYATNPVIYTVGLAIAENAPSSKGGAVVAYSVAPPLPSGLSFDTDSGVISGTPAQPSGAPTDYTVSATNSGGSTTATVSITVHDEPPSDLTYATNPAIYAAGVTVSDNTPSSKGGAVLAYTIAPALPAGLSLDTGSGVISGTPSELSAATVYTVTATNSGGSAVVTVSITVNDEPPSDLTYATNPAIYTAGVTVSDNTPSSKGGAVLAYWIAPALPAGLSFDKGSGVISGTPTEPGAPTDYVVTAANSGGGTTAPITITINEAPPSELTYAANPATYTVGVAIAENAPSSKGGMVTAYSITPALPAGLSLDPGSGVISGAPAELSAATDYVISATNSGGSTTASVNITVNDAPPSELAYSVNPAIYTKGDAVSDNTPSSKGGAVLAYAIAPALPAGLSLDPGSGVISGTPSERSPATEYVVTATNSGGSNPATVTITVAGRHPQYTKSGPFNVAENSTEGTPAGDLDADDADGGAKDLGVTYAIQSGNDSVDGDATPAFALDPDTGALTVGDRDDLDHERKSSFALVIRATDEDGFTDGTVIIRVDDVPEAPVTTGLTPINVMVGAADGVIDLAAAFSDEEEASADLSYSIGSNSNTALFTSVLIDKATDQLTLGFAPNSTGTATLQIVATDSDSQSVAATLVITVSGDAVQQWRSAQFSAADLGDPAKEATVWGNAANPDGDHWSNAFEFFFGTDPNGFDVDYPINYEVHHQVDVDLVAVLQFERSKAVPAGLGMVESSGDLSRWQPVTAPAVVVEDLGNRERVRVSIPLKREQARQHFVRLVIDP